MSSTVVIANPHSGSADDGERLARYAVDQLGWEWRWTKHEHDAMRWARDAAARGAERIVAGGGDGTVHLVVQGILRTSARPVLAVLPLGTGNDLVRTLGFDVDVDAVLEELARGTDVRAIDLARARIGGHERVLVNASAAGFSGEVDRAIDEDEKARWGPFAYVRGALEVMSDLPCYRVVVEVDGQKVADLEAVGLTVSNGRTCGGGLRVAPDADLEDGMLDVLVVEHTSKLALAGVGARLRAGRVVNDRHTLDARGGRVIVRSDPAMPFNVDGELLGDVRIARFEVLPRELPVAIGPAYEAERRAMRERRATLTGA